MKARKSSKGAIIVWRFQDAPPEYQALSENGGDEDWLAFLPETFSGESVGWMDAGSSSGWGVVSEHRVVGGVVRIGGHS